MNRYVQKLIKRMTTRLIILVAGTAIPVLTMESKLVNRGIKRLFVESGVEPACSAIAERSKENFWKR